MRIIIYKEHNKYLSFHFPAIELDKVRKMCYDIGIKYYVINFNRSE
jgi:hypothetical protein